MQAMYLVWFGAKFCTVSIYTIKLVVSRLQWSWMDVKLLIKINLILIFVLTHVTMSLYT